MLEFVIGSLFFASWGVNAIVASTYLHQWQIRMEKRNEDEEELLTHYEPKEDFGTETNSSKNGSANRGWEFKIVRARGNIFHDPAVFNTLCREEAQAGWILLEKLDDRRVRFRRSIATRNKYRLNKLGFDPYRCHYGSSGIGRIWLAAIALLFAMAIPAYAGYWVMSQFLLEPTPRTTRQTAPNRSIPQNYSR